jgi:hypothetical protein
VVLQPPDYAGTGLVNLVAELELRLRGEAPSEGLADPSVVPEASGFVLAMFDGLGDHQLKHPAARPLEESRRTVLTAGFPTTTTTSLSTLVTGLPPGGHGVIGHLLHLPGVAEVVNLLKWITPAGKPVAHDYASVLPRPNLFERLRSAGREPITVQPGLFMGSPLSTMLYRGCRFEPAWTAAELIEATRQVAGPNRLVVTYFPDVDVAAHVDGQDGDSYRRALETASEIWERLSSTLPPEIGLVGTADHGHLDYSPADKILIRDPTYGPLRFFGDPRSTYVSGPSDLIDRLIDETGATGVGGERLLAWLGPAPHHPELAERLPDRLLLAPRGKLLLPRPFDKRLIGYHGGLEQEEVEVPLLVR